MLTKNTVKLCIFTQSPKKTNKQSKEPRPHKIKN